MDKTTGTITKILKNTSASSIDKFMKENSDEIISDIKPFATYVRKLIKEKGISQQDIFINADLSASYGYKIISEEKHTKQRDTILRICFASHFNFEETQRALTIYGMSPLYPRFSRDAVLIVALNNKIFDVQRVNEYLIQHKEKPLCDIEME